KPLSLRDSFKGFGIDALFVSSVPNVHYLTGFAGEDSFLLIGSEAAYLITDSRYTEEAEQTAKGVKVFTYRTDMFEDAAKLAADMGVKKLGFEPDVMNCAMHGRMLLKFPKTRIIPAEGIVQKLRVLKSPAEVKMIEAAIAVAEDALNATLPKLKRNVTETTIARELRYNLSKAGAQDVSFPPIVAFDAKSSLPHARPGDAKLGKNALVLFDWGARKDFYCSDCTRVFFIGNVPPVIEQIYDIVMEADKRAAKALKPGVPLKDVDAVARDYIRDKGYGDKFGHGLGHGVGIEIHEAPRLNSRSTEIATPGMIVTIEAGIYLPGIGGIRVEDMALVTEKGCRILTHFPREPRF
ncbi:MAG: Xaa-Pro peptidase family protein, partial [Candidatus Brocadiia bacterium]